jgi:hypothetical protein
MKRLLPSACFGAVLSTWVVPALAATSLYANHTLFGASDAALGIGRSSSATSISCSLTLSGYLGRAYPVR